MQMIVKPDPSFAAEIASLVWEAKYRWRDAAGHAESGIEETWQRVAHALAAAEPHDREHWAHRFYEALANFRFIPGGRVLAGAGTGRRVTLFNCFVMGAIEDYNLQYCESNNATNPCGEVPLPPYGACDLGSINLTRFVHEPFSEHARLDLGAIVALVPVAVRMLDNVYDVSRYPLPRQRDTALGARRIGLGITGLADALTMLGLRYGCEASLKLAGGLMRTIAHAAYNASVALAREKGAFPLFRADAYLAGGFASRLPPDLRDRIAAHGIRNSHLTAIVPAGTISLLAGNVSSGLEPAYGADYLCRVRFTEHEVRGVEVTDYACALFRRRGGTGVPPAFVAAHDVTPEDHLAMQAELQAHVDNAIAKTINVPRRFSFAHFAPLYEHAYRLGLKG